MKSVSVIVPTYNELENIMPLYRQLDDVIGDKYKLELIFVDDNSPDGTQRMIENISLNDVRVKLINRPKKLGLGSAVIDGIHQSAGEYIVMMDGDLSHRPSDVVNLIGGLGDYSVVVGSRRVESGGSVGWPIYRRFMSWVATATAKFVLGVKVRDITSGFAAFRRSAILPLLPGLNPRGFKILMEILTKLDPADVCEVPIIFVDRERGQSKFSGYEAILFGLYCLELARYRIWRN